MAMLAGVLAFMIPFYAVTFYDSLISLMQSLGWLLAAVLTYICLVCRIRAVYVISAVVWLIFIIFAVPAWVSYFINVYECRLGVIKVCLNFLPANHLNYVPVVCLSKHGKWPSKRYAFAA